MNTSRLNYRYWEHEVWNDPKTPLVARYTNIVDGCDPTVAIGGFEFCTGLKDKNGNLIYEGDILRTYDEDWVIVEWADCGFKALIDDTYYDLDDIIDKYTQIISNIHEQKDNK